MTITTEESRLLEQLDTFTAEERALVNDTFTDLRENARAIGIELAMNDIAARFEAALIRYILDSKK